ncbi:MAG: preprotein translocase subunit SecG, partial [Clostridia bacterium]|nr:preprotein translocase subunit SecG [Clostridia bacterium]
QYLIWKGEIQMTVLEIVLTIIMLLIAVGLVVVISMQESAQQGAGTLYGGTSDLLGKNQSKSKEQKLVRYTKILGIALVVLSIGMVLLQKLG